MPVFNLRVHIILLKDKPRHIKSTYRGIYQFFLKSLNLYSPCKSDALIFAEYKTEDQQGTTVL
jgi:hypothetical protein